MSASHSLHGVLDSICFSDFECCLFRTAFLLAFFAALCICELVAINKLVASGLFLEEVVFKNDSISICIRKSKTDQIGKGVWIVINKYPDSILCPVKALMSYLDIRPTSSGVLLLLQHSYLTKDQFNAVLKKHLVKLNLQSYQISLHSFRIGATTEGARMGLKEDPIKKLGRWESERFKIK